MKILVILALFGMGMGMTTAEEEASDNLLIQYGKLLPYVTTENLKGTNDFQASMKNDAEGKMLAARIIELMDANKDGLLEESEVLAIGEFSVVELFKLESDDYFNEAFKTAVFIFADLNHDGFISEFELYLGWMPYFANNFIIYHFNEYY